MVSFSYTFLFLLFSIIGDHSTSIIGDHSSAKVFIGHLSTAHFFIGDNSTVYAFIGDKCLANITFCCPTSQQELKLPSVRIITSARELCSAYTLSLIHI